MKADERSTRRDLLVAIARAASVAALIGGAALLTWRNRHATCSGRTACESCGLRSRCRLPAKSTPRPR